MAEIRPLTCRAAAGIVSTPVLGMVLSVFSFGISRVSVASQHLHARSSVPVSLVVAFFVTFHSPQS